MEDFKAGTVDVRERLAYQDFINEYVIPHRPVVIKNAFPQWKALERWTPEYFKSRFADKRIRVAGEWTTMGQYIDRVVSATPDDPVPYLRECVIRHFAQELAEDLSPFTEYALPNWLSGVYPGWWNGVLNRAAEPELFIGGLGTRLLRRAADEEENYSGSSGPALAGYADLHYDPTNCPVLLCQIYGRKHFTVFSPSDTPFLYTKGRLSKLGNLDAPDFSTYPLARQATAIRFIQEPGHAVYVPPLWWHATKMMSVSIAVSSTFANQVHWEGVIDDVTLPMRRKHPRVADAMARYLRLDGAIKAKLGDRYGEHPFRTRYVETAVKTAKKAAKSMLKGVWSPSPEQS